MKIEEEQSVSPGSMQESKKTVALDHSVLMVEPERLQEDDEEKEDTVSTSRCLSERQRQLLVAIFGVGLSGLMTFCLIYLLNRIRGE